MIYLRNILFNLVFFSGSVLYVLAALGALLISKKHVRKIADGWSGWHHWCAEKLLGIIVRETGQRPQQQVLYAVKHEAFFEAIAMPHLFDHPAPFGKAELFDIPGWGRAAREYGVIPVARGDGAKALRTMVREVQPALKAGRPIIIFPEGTRIPHGTNAPLQSGFIALYKLLRLPVVPVAVNSGPLYQQRWKKAGTITMHFGEPIEPGLPREEIEARVHRAINCLNDAPAAEQFPAGETA